VGVVWSHERATRSFVVWDSAGGEGEKELKGLFSPCTKGLGLAITHRRCGTKKREDNRTGGGGDSDKTGISFRKERWETKRSERETAARESWPDRPRGKG